MSELRGYRWAVLAVGCLGQARYGAILVGPAAISPVIRQGYHLSLPALGLVLDPPTRGFC